MIHGYHVIFGTYGFWLPNDPRGSWSEFVGSWELLQFGKPTWSTNRRELSKAEQLARGKAKKSLKFPEVTLSGHQALAVGTGFANSVRKSSYTVWACSILPQHVHLVLGRHEYQVEQVVNLMKGEATKQLTSRGVHPMADFKSPAGKAPNAMGFSQMESLSRLGRIGRKRDPLC